MEEAHQRVQGQQGQQVCSRLAYPQLVMNVQKLKHNINEMVKLCGSYGISVIGVIKGFNGIAEGTKQFDQSGCRYIASSRLEQLEEAANSGVKKPLMLIRSPMVCEIEKTVRLAKASLNSELATIQALNEEAMRQQKIHEVILMVDLGDLREGFWDKQELLAAAVAVEEEMPGLHLLGIGTSLGCYGSISATEENMQELIGYAEAIEARIGRQLELISGGMTKSLPLVLAGKMPARINNLRIGEAIILAQELPELYGCDLSFMYQDTFVLKAQIIELKDKPTYPVGVQAFDAFGQSGQYEDRGIRKRALLAVGKLDIAYPELLIPMEEGMTIIGASSDHLIVDVEECARPLQVGDILSFQFSYAPLIYATSSPNVKLNIIR